MAILKYIASTLKFILLLLLMAFFLLSGGLIVAFTFMLFASPLCGEELVKQSYSTGDYVANVYVRDCGATTDFSTHINIFKKDREVGSDFSGTITEGEVLVLPDKMDIVIKWKSETELELTVAGYNPENLRYNRSIGPVQITVK